MIEKLPVFPELRCEDILLYQCSSWYPKFADIALRTTIIRPLDETFCHYLDADGVTVPHGADNLPATSELSDDDDDFVSNISDDNSSEEQAYTFPELDAQIRAAVSNYGAVFPKLNFTAPQDAQWAISDPNILRCTSPADVYLLLKSSNLINHDRDPALVFQDCIDRDAAKASGYQLELVLKQWETVTRSQEFRCFVRSHRLIGISQRDPNYYDFLINKNLQERVIDTCTSFWRKHIKEHWAQPDYTVDVVLDTSFSSARLVDFNPYSTMTDPMLFSYHQLRDKAASAAQQLPTLKVVQSRTDAYIRRGALAGHDNRMPLEAFYLDNLDDLQHAEESPHTNEQWIMD